MIIRRQKTVFVLEDSIVNKLNGFPPTQKLNHNCLVKVQPFNSAKVRCMHDHAKPALRDFDPVHIILHCGTNDLNSDRTSSQIAKEIIDLAVSLKTDKNKISVLKYFNTESTLVLQYFSTKDGIAVLF